MLVRDFIINTLKPKYKLTLQVISANTKRNSNTFRSQIFEGSQCNATYKMNFFASAQQVESSSLNKFFAKTTPLVNAKSTEISKGNSDLGEKEKGNFLTKMLLFEDVDTVF